MLIMTGKIVMIESKEIVKSEIDRFMKVTLVLVKQMKGKKRNVCFESYGKVAKEILNFRNGERIRVYFTIDSVPKNGSWYHTLKAVEVEKEVKAQKNDNTNQNTINYDTTEKGFE
jgi:formylmethanofuran dehydrogenase subunit E